MKVKSRILAFLLVVVVLAGTMAFTTQDVLKNIRLGLDLQGGFEVLYDVETLDGKKVNQEDVKNTTDALSRRVDKMGVSEPSIQVEGNNRIRVQLAGVEDQETAREMLSTSANLTFRDVEDNILLDGNDLKQNGAKATFHGETNRPIVTLTLKDAEKFGEITTKISQKPSGENLLVVWMDFEEGVDSYVAESQKPDPRYVSAAAVSKPLHTTDVMIEGGFSVDETQNFANILNAGSLPVKMTEVFSTSVGAQFGEQALKSTVFAGVAGVLAIFVFMLLYYRLPGLISIITLTVFTYLVLIVFNGINAVLTLPGIAAIVLGIGMAVDANILTAERIREELRVGHSIKQAFQLGSKQSLSAIIDAQLTTLLVAAVLYAFGASSVKGFATMLIISILLSFITAVWGSRILLNQLVLSGYFNNPGLYGIPKSKQHDLSENLTTIDLTTKFDRIDFVHNRKKFYTFSLAILVVGIIAISVFRLNLGIDFSSGTRVDIVSEQEVTKEEISKFIKEIGHPSDDIVISGDKKNIGVVRYTEDFSKQETLQFKKDVSEKYGEEPSVSNVSPTVGKELVKNAIYALAVAAIGILIYVAIRFEWRMGVGTIVSLLHDVFLIVAIFSIFRLEVDITFIAAVLTIVGYSINDTIVTFDRIRENLNAFDEVKDKNVLANIVNKSLRQTMGRSVNTVLTVIIVVVALLVFGAPSLTNFSIALLAGLITGIYSSICIAAQVWYSLKIREMDKSGGKLKKKEKKQWGTDEPTV